VSGEYLPGVHGALLFGIVVNPVSIGHFTSLVATQNGHVTLCGTSFALLYGPETVNVFLHCMQVMIFSKTFGLENGSEYTPVSPAPHSTSRVVGNATNPIAHLAHAAAAGTDVGPWVTTYILDLLLSEKRTATA
jgi:hypothetical protein